MRLINITSHLIVNHRGGVRLTKNKPALDADEIAIRVDLQIPESFFSRPYPVLSVKLPDPGVGIDPDVAVDLTAKTVADYLKVDVDSVRDGLAEAMKQAAQS